MANYQMEQHESFGDFYAYCDVFNFHIERVAKWENGVALVKLAHNMMAIFNGHNMKAYYFDLDSVPEMWVKDQFDKCATKYACSKSEALQIQIECEAAWDEVVMAKREQDL